MEFLPDLELITDNDSDESDEELEFKGFDYLEKNMPRFSKDLASTMLQMKGMKATHNGFRTLKKYVSGAVTLREAQNSMRQARLEASLQEEAEQREAIQLLEEIVEKSPVFRSVPERLRKKLIPKELTNCTPLPEGSIVFLYDGVQDHLLGKSTSEEFKERNPSLSNKVVAYDIKQSRAQDIHGRLYQQLLVSALLGRVSVLITGPNCRTWSILLNRVIEGKSPPVRERSDPWNYAGPEKSEFWTNWLDKESLLFLKPMLILMVCKCVDIYGNNPVGFLVEHPEDPEKSPEKKRDWLKLSECKTSNPSVWATEFMVELQRFLEGEFQHFDQGPLGHFAKKSTTVFTNLQVSLNGIRGKGSLPVQESVGSDKLSRWAPDFRTIVIEGIQRHLGIRQAIKDMSEFPQNASMYTTSYLKPFRCTKKTSEEEFKKGPAIHKTTTNTVEATSDKYRSEEVQEMKNGQIVWADEHCRSGHWLFSRDCPACVQGALRGRQHRRVLDEDRETEVLAIDLAGPFRPGIIKGRGQIRGGEKVFPRRSLPI